MFVNILSLTINIVFAFLIIKTTEICIETKNIKKYSKYKTLKKLNNLSILLGTFNLIIKLF
jgi:hypothetical protein